MLQNRTSPYSGEQSQPRGIFIDFTRLNNQFETMVKQGNWLTIHRQTELRQADSCKLSQGGPSQRHS